MPETRKPEDRASDGATCEMLRKAEAEGADTCFTRMDQQAAQCGFGKAGICCRICHLGPCRITQKAPRGVCGADADTIVARNYLREVAGGAAAHSDHGRHLVLLLKAVAEGRGGSYRISDERALRDAARKYGIEDIGRSKEAVAGDLAETLLREFTAQEGKLQTLGLAPLKRQAVWQQHGIEPTGIDRTMVEALHRTTMGVDHDYRHLLMHAFRASLADGWGGSRIATIVSDILFGTPQPVQSAANLGVLGERTVNVVVHGHEPALSDQLALASRDAEVIAAARAAGAEGITLAGICCTANEILIRHGVPLAGNFLQQELAVLTGAVEMLLV
ncbi:MAG: carbon monoxide dehydrogenase, partial [Planctomycetota bacterium]|nr:carbon monoxide dehydrogenase [Planctomycetota bacterium]